MRYINMGFTGMFSVETVLKIIGFGIKVGILETNKKTTHTQKMNTDISANNQKRSALAIGILNRNEAIFIELCVNMV